MFDAHNHLDRCEDPAAALAGARAAGVHGQLVAGVDPAGWAAQAALARGAPDLHLAYGVHPWTVARLDEAGADAALAALERALDGAEGVRPVALGELGLDRTRHVPAESLPRQERLFRTQLALARARDLPVVLHVVRAHGHALDLLRRDGLPRRGGMLHSTSAPAELVEAYLALGLHLSFSASLTRHPRVARAAARVPLDRLLVETDAPDQPPAGHDGANQPALLGRVVEALAAARGAAPAQIGLATAANARRLLGLEARSASTQDEAGIRRRTSGAPPVVAG